jgi:SAM-dependent methyltransferase
MLNTQQVTDAYELILGRSPESERVVEEKLAVETRAKLGEELFTSQEFQERYVKLLNRPSPDIFAHSLLPHIDVETTTKPHMLEQLFANTAAAWDKLGNEDAFWSVLTHDDFRKDVLSQNQEAFEASSEYDFWMMKRAADLAGRPLSSFEHMIELGCGVGRVTKRAAPHFKRYTAIDVSAPHLKFAQERTDSKTTTFMQIGKPQDFENLPSFDFFFSRLVLQHNPPPIIGYILRTVLRKLSPNGIALFQVPTYHPDYTFKTVDYLSQAKTGMEMHIYPQPDILKIIRKNRCTVLSIQQERDPGTDDPLFVSHTFLVRKNKDLLTKIKYILS